MALTTVQFGAVAFIGIIFAIFSPVPTQMNLPIIGAILYLAIPSSMIGILSQVISQKHTTPSRAALIFSLEAVFGATFSIIFGFEGITLKLIIGCSLIFASILMSELYAAKLAAKPIKA